MGVIIFEFQQLLLDMIHFKSIKSIEQVEIGCISNEESILVTFSQPLIVQMYILM